jgi:hypothetical protein
MQSEGPSHNMVSLAGWVFADLLLALMVIFMATGNFRVQAASTSIPLTATVTPPPTSIITPTPGPTPTLDLQMLCSQLYSTPTSTPLVCPIPTPILIGLEQNPSGFYKGSDIYEFINDLTANFSGRKAGLVLIYGYSADTSGYDIACRNYETLKASLPDMFSVAVARCGYVITPANSLGGLEVYVYFFNQ